MIKLWIIYQMRYSKKDEELLHSSSFSRALLNFKAIVSHDYCFKKRRHIGITNKRNAYEINSKTIQILMIAIQLYHSATRVNTKLETTIPSADMALNAPTTVALFPHLSKRTAI